MQYRSSLMSHNYGWLRQYYANTHPSIGNYFMPHSPARLLTNDGTAKLLATTTAPVSVDNVVRALGARGRPKAYAESLPSVGLFHGGADVTLHQGTNTRRHRRDVSGSEHAGCGSDGRGIHLTRSR